ncbi:hypothetical protein QE152_g6725 [Popillia japonica]|uniref:Uncharacterized protein n=1 Tax=Popillia japonica TaxID=7064 RepID=A0AAW1MJD5_POPJA
MAFKGETSKNTKTVSRRERTSSDHISEKKNKMAFKGETSKNTKTVSRRESKRRRSSNVLMNLQMMQRMTVKLFMMILQAPRMSQTFLQDAEKRIVKQKRHKLMMILQAPRMSQTFLQDAEKRIVKQKRHKIGFSA